MLELFANSSFVAQDLKTEQAAPANPGDDAGKAPVEPVNPLYQMVFMGLTIAILFYVMMVRPNQRKEKERKSLLESLKKNDHVVTIGGIKGVIASVNQGDDEIVLRVDETTGAKLRVMRSSIARVISAEGDGDSSKRES